MGRVTAPFGVKGWLRIHALTAQIESLRAYPVWWLARGADWIEMRVAAVKAHGDTLVAQLNGITDRAAAAALGRPDWLAGRERRRTRVRARQPHAADWRQ